MAHNDSAPDICTNTGISDRDTALMLLHAIFYRQARENGIGRQEKLFSPL